MAYIRWKERKYEKNYRHNYNFGEGVEKGRFGKVKVRGIKYASLVHSFRDKDGKIKQKILAYLGSNPSITKELKIELEKKYPKIKFNWEKIEKRLVVPHSGTGSNVGTKSLKWVYEHREQLRKDRNLSIADLRDIASIYYGNYEMTDYIDSKDYGWLGKPGERLKKLLKFLKMIYSMKEIKFSKKRVEKNIQKLNDIINYHFESGSWYTEDMLKRNLAHHKKLAEIYSK